MIISLHSNKFWCLDYKRSVYISLLVIIQSFPISSRSFVTLLFVHTDRYHPAWAIDTRRVLTSRLNANIILTKKGPFLVCCLFCVWPGKIPYNCSNKSPHCDSVWLGKGAFQGGSIEIRRCDLRLARTNVITQLFNTLTNSPGSGFWRQ